MKYIKYFKIFEAKVSDAWHLFLDIIETGKFRVNIKTGNPDSSIALNPEYDCTGRNYNDFFDPAKSADNGCSFNKAKQGTSSEFFEYHFNRKVGTKNGFIIEIVPKDYKLFDVRTISDDLMTFKEFIEPMGYKCRFYKDIIAIGSGFNNKQDIDIENSVWIYRLSIVVKK